MTSWNYGPVLSNLPLPLISLTHPGMWQVERFAVLQLKYIQSFFSITGSEEEGGGLQRSFCQCSEQLSARAWHHMGGIRRRRMLFSYPVWPLCTKSKHHSPSFPLILFVLFHCLLPFGVSVWVWWEEDPAGEKLLCRSTSCYPLLCTDAALCN